MRAAVYRGNKRFEVEEVPTPEVGPSQVLVKVSYSAICGTDVHYVLYDVLATGSVIGHEYSRTIAQVGADVTRWRVGDRVVGGGGTPPPGKESHITTDPRFSYRTSGLAGGTGGGYAEQVLMEERAPMVIPDEVSDEVAALCAPCAIAVHAVGISDLKVGDSVAVLGAGPIGLLCIQVARAAGAGEVSEPAPARREAARSLGADAVIDPTDEDAVSAMVSLTDGLGPDVVFECAAAKSTLDQALSMARRSGQVVLVAIAWEPTSVLPVEWLGREVVLKTSASKTVEDWGMALELIRPGKVRMEPLLSEASFVPLGGVQGAFEALFKPTDAAPDDREALTARPYDAAPPWVLCSSGCRPSAEGPGITGRFA